MERSRLRDDWQTPDRMRANAEIGRTLASAGRAATERALDLSEGRQGARQQSPTGKRSRTARQGERRPARSTSRPRNGTQSTNLRNWSARNAGRGTPTHRRRRRSHHDPLSNCASIARKLIVTAMPPKPNDRAAHGSPSSPANNWQATEQRESALSQSSSTLGPAIKRVADFPTNAGDGVPLQYLRSPTLQGNLVVSYYTTRRCKLEVKM